MYFFVYIIMYFCALVPHNFFLLTTMVSRAVYRNFAMGGGANLWYGKKRGGGSFVLPWENFVIFSALSFNLVQTDQTRYSHVFKINFFLKYQKCKGGGKCPRPPLNTALVSIFYASFHCYMYFAINYLILPSQIDISFKLHNKKIALFGRFIIMHYTLQGSAHTGRHWSALTTSQPFKPPLFNINRKMV